MAKELATEISPLLCLVLLLCMYKYLCALADFMQRRRFFCITTFKKIKIKIVSCLEGGKGSPGLLFLLSKAEREGNLHEASMTIFFFPISLMYVEYICNCGKFS